MTWENDLELQMAHWHSLHKNTYEIERLRMEYLENIMTSLPVEQQSHMFSSIGKNYLDYGKNLKERYGNAIEGRKYFQEVLRRDVPHLHPQARYHLGHVSLLFDEYSEALRCFEEALQTTQDTTIRIKSYYYAAECLVYLKNLVKSEHYLQEGRTLDAGFQFQNEYEQLRRTLDNQPQTAQHSHVYEISLSRNKPISIDEAQLKELCTGNVHAIDALKKVSPLVFILNDPHSKYHFHLFSQGTSIPLRLDIVEMVLALSQGKPESDQYWLDHVFTSIHTVESLEVTIKRVNRQLSDNEFPFRIRRQGSMFHWRGPRVYDVVRVDDPHWGDKEDEY